MTAASPWMSPPASALPADDGPKKKVRPYGARFKRDAKSSTYIYTTHGSLESERTSDTLAKHGPQSGVNMSEVDAKIAASEARTDTKFAEMMGELRVISTRLDHVEKSTSGIKSTVISTGVVTAVAVLALVTAIFGWGSQMFGVGMNADSVARQAAEAVRQETSAQFDNLNTRYQSLESEIGTLIEAVRSRVPERLDDGSSQFQLTPNHPSDQ